MMPGENLEATTTKAHEDYRIFAPRPPQERGFVAGRRPMKAPCR